MLICGKYFCFRKCLISRWLRIVSEPPVEPQADDPEHGFAEDAAAHPIVFLSARRTRILA